MFARLSHWLSGHGHHVEHEADDLQELEELAQRMLSVQAKATRLRERYSAYVHALFSVGDLGSELAQDLFRFRHGPDGLSGEWQAHQAARKRRKEKNSTQHSSTGKALKQQQPTAAGDHATQEKKSSSSSSSTTTTTTNNNKAKDGKPMEEDSHAENYQLGTCLQGTATAATTLQDDPTEHDRDGATTSGDNTLQQTSATDASARASTAPAEQTEQSGGGHDKHDHNDGSDQAAIAAAEEEEEEYLDEDMANDMLTFMLQFKQTQFTLTAHLNDRVHAASKVFNSSFEKYDSICEHIRNKIASYRQARKYVINLKKKVQMLTQKMTRSGAPKPSESQKKSLEQHNIRLQKYSSALVWLRGSLREMSSELFGPRARFHTFDPCLLALVSAEMDVFQTASLLTQPLAPFADRLQETIAAAMRRENYEDDEGDGKAGDSDAEGDDEDDDDDDDEDDDVASDDDMAGLDAALNSKEMQLAAQFLAEEVKEQGGKSAERRRRKRRKQRLLNLKQTLEGGSETHHTSSGGGSGGASEAPPHLLKTPAHGKGASPASSIGEFPVPDDGSALSEYVRLRQSFGGGKLGQLSLDSPSALGGAGGGDHASSPRAWSPDSPMRASPVKLARAESPGHGLVAFGAGNTQGSGGESTMTPQHRRQRTHTSPQQLLIDIELAAWEASAAQNLDTLLTTLHLVLWPAAAWTRLKSVDVQKDADLSRHYSTATRFLRSCVSEEMLAQGDSTEASAKRVLCDRLLNALHAAHAKWKVRPFSNVPGAIKTPVTSASATPSAVPAAST